MTDAPTDIVVADFTIVIDGREKAPWQFKSINANRGGRNHKVVVKTKYKHLVTGDYSIEGYEDKIAIERKSKEDAYGTFGGGREQFERELGRLQKMDLAAVIIESEWSDLMLYPPARSKMRPRSVLGSVLAWSQDFAPVTFWCVPGKLFAEKVCFRMLSRWWRKREESDT